MLILFPDDLNVIDSSNITYQQARIKPSEPILAPELDWEFPRTNLYGSVFKKVDIYEMYYQCANALRVGYAVSKDGINWHKPMTNPVDFNAAFDELVKPEISLDQINNSDLGNTLQATNLVAACHMPSVIYDAGSDKPYKLFSFGEEGYQVSFSENGKQFKPYPENPAIKLLSYKNEHTDKVWCSDVAPCFKDVQGYNAMVKTYHVDEEQRTRRCIGYAKSKNFTDWSEVETIWIPGEDEDKIAQNRGYKWADFYGLCPFPYGEGYLGFLWLFEIEKELPRGTNLGKIEVFLAYSVDCKKWRRVDDKPLIPWDLNFGANGGMVTTPSAPIFDTDDIKVYYSDSNFEHGFTEKDFEKTIESPTWVIRCAQLPKERLIGAYSESGVIRLKEQKLKGKKLRLNADCLLGEIRIDLIRSGVVDESFTIKNANHFDYLLSNKDKGDASLEIHLTKASLYAIEIF